jgi:hypothetical protein
MSGGQRHFDPTRPNQNVSIQSSTRVWAAFVLSMWEWKEQLDLGPEDAPDLIVYVRDILGQA